MQIEELKSAVSGELKSALEARDKKSDELGEQIDHLRTKSEADSVDIKGRLDGTNEEIKGLNETITKIEGKLASFGSAGEAKSLGESLTSLDEYKSAVDSGLEHGFQHTFGVKDITNAANVATGVTRSIMTPQHEAGHLETLRMKLRVRGLIPNAPTDSNAIRYTQRGAHTNNAAAIAEGAAYPISDAVFSEKVANVEKMGHIYNESLEILRDAPAVANIIDFEGRYHLSLVEEQELLHGTGTTPRIHGILPQATAFDPATITGTTPATIVDEIRLAKRQAAKSYVPATGIVMNEDDWTQIELMKEATTNQYLFSSVTSGATPLLWGMPVVTTDSMAPGSFLVGSFALGAEIRDNMGMTVKMSTEHNDNFGRDMLSIKFSKRLALVVKRPEAFIYKAAS